MKKILGKSEFVSNSLILIFGIGFAQLVPVLLQPILRRMFDPEDFGLFAVYFAVVSTFAIIANFRYSQVVVLPKEDDEGLDVVAGGLILTLVFAIFLFFFLFFFGTWCIDYFQLPAGLKKWMLLMPISVILVSGSLMVNSWLTRKKGFKSMATNKIARRGAEGVAHIGLGFSKFNGGLIIGTLIGDFFNLLVSFFQFKKHKGHFKSISKKGLKTQLKKYKDFPLYNLIPTVLDTASLFLPVFIISSYYNNEITGQFDLSRQILALPLALISAAIGQVLVQKLAEKSNLNEKITPLITKNFIFLAGLGLVGVLIFVPFGEIIFTWVFGDEWLLAGELTTILVFSYALRFCVTPLSIMFVAINKVKISSAWQIAYFAVICVLFFLKDISIQRFIFYYALLEVVSYFIYLLLIYVGARKHDKNLEIN